jgi:three-Cys-motif partner protein
MMTRRPKVGGGKAHQFGGDWTSAKLDVLAKYLRAYTTALKEQPSKERPFRKTYIDAFAGTGYREAQRDDDAASGQQGLLLPDLAADEPQALLDGSARLALKTEPRFDRYVFIERSPARCAQLEGLKVEFSGLADSIEIKQGDANTEIQKFCTAEDWRSSRAVLFLDPYGMQVEWATLETIAGTKAIDMWLLFPLGIGVNRLLTRSGDIPDSWRRRLNLLLGTEDWYEEFYRVEAASAGQLAEQSALPPLLCRWQQSWRARSPAHREPPPKGRHAVRRCRRNRESFGRLAAQNPRHGQVMRQ